VYKFHEESYEWELLDTGLKTPRSEISAIIVPVPTILLIADWAEMYTKQLTKLQDNLNETLLSFVTFAC